MNNKLPIRPPQDTSDIADAGWNSGTMGRTLSGYSPAALIIEVQRLLRSRGVAVEPTPGMLHTASIAAADLLRALGVSPQSAPTVTSD